MTSFRHLFIACALMAGAAIAAPFTATAGGTVINDPSQPQLGPYSHAVRAGNLLFVSGIIGFDAASGGIAEGGVEAQLRQIFRNLKSVLAAADADLSHVVKVTVFLQEPADFDIMNKIYAEYFTHDRPARSTVPGVEWGKGVLAEIEVIAYLP